MDKAHYKAYLSYSHRDERWAGWLHRALERYRVPARLRAEHGGDLPARLAPIFRDREDRSRNCTVNQVMGFHCMAAAILGGNMATLYKIGVIKNHRVMSGGRI